MSEEKTTSRSSGRIRLEPKIRGGGKRDQGDPLDQEQDRVDDGIRTINVEEVIKKNAIRLVISIIIFALVLAIKSLPFSVAQKVSQGIKWAVTYHMDWKDDVMDRRNIIPAISHQIERFIGTKEVVDDFEKDHSYISPVTGLISSPFEESVHPIFNTKIEARGIEISGQSAREIKAIERGKVIQVQESIFGGKKIVLEHELSMRSVYEGCFDSTISVNDEVEQGKVIGRTKSVEDVLESVFYFELWKGDQVVNPSDYIEFEEHPAG